MMATTTAAPTATTAPPAATATDSNTVSLNNDPNTPQTIQAGHKVFIGNLSFKTTKESLSLFASSYGKVLDAMIITKRRRPLGYGFVTFETEKEAQTAAHELDNKTVDGRNINAEIARPKVEQSAESHKTPKSKRNALRRNKSSKKNESATTTTTTTTTITEEPIATTNTTITKKEESTTSEDKKEEGGGEERSPEQIAKEAAARRKRNQKDKKRQNKKKSAEKATRITEPSKTTLFVANLPYVTTDDDLKKIFDGFKLASAHIARMNNGCSKGYGFVEFQNQEEQLKAFESVKDVVLEGRSIYLKVALSEHKLPVSEVEAATTVLEDNGHSNSSSHSVEEEKEALDTNKDTTATTSIA